MLLGAFLSILKKNWKVCELFRMIEFIKNSISLPFRKIKLMKSQLIKIKLSRKFLALFVTGFFSLVSLAGADQSTSKVQEYTTAVQDAKGEQIGSLKLRKASGGVLINISLKGLEPGMHGMHFHKSSKCDHDMSFKTAEGHIDPDKKPHGFLNPEGPHEGNLPNLVVHSDGSAEVELYSQLVTFDSGKAGLFDENGSSLIIHTNPDDHFSQPIGGAGGRVACASIK